MLALDHIAVGCADLDNGTAWVAAQLGVQLSPGGRHDRYGTHNTLLGLADGLYLEVIAPDHRAGPVAGHRWFGLDAFAGPPRLVNWICQTDDLPAAVGAAPAAVGDIQSLQRGDLHWQITVPDDGSLPFDGGYPTLMQWAAGTRHPAERLPESGCRLLEFIIMHPQAARLQGMLRLNDPRIVFCAGPVSFSARFDTPHGHRVLS
ncbi:VOC family protein [Yoonia sp.]|uniref:VOC family protein n=1 Tax=Yoonia sp. TaxID=2212373 RepID=UPI0019FBBF9C|nr:VOC family protein [Yoonia sp.]MBE0414367.1 VOC family protein [Yoonia sp.]